MPAGGRTAWTGHVDFDIALKDGQLVLEGPACVFMSATLSINGGYPVLITNTLALLKKFLEPGETTARRLLP